MSVEVVPSQLGFQRPLTQLVKRTLTVSNPNPQPIAFKVKTTAPKQYCVRPNSGRIEPGERVEVSVLLQPMKEDPEPGAKCRDKFLVQSTIITPEKESRPFQELWSLVEKEDRASIAEHKIRCAYLPFSSEDPNSTSPRIDHPTHKALNNRTSQTLNNHTNRDDDDDPRYNSVKSHSIPGFHGLPSSPPNRSEPDLPETTVYDLARDETFLSRQSHLSSPAAPLKAPSSARKSSTHDDKKIDTASNYPTVARVSSGHFSNGGNKSQTFITHTSVSADDVQKLKAQLTAALAEVERLKNQLNVTDDGLKKRNNSTGAAVNRVHSADMMALGAHGLKGPEGLVPVQTVVLISIGVFAFTWLFF